MRVPSQLAADRRRADSGGRGCDVLLVLHRGSRRKRRDTDLYARAIDGLRKQGRAFPASMVKKMEKVLAEMRGSKGGGGGR